MCPLNKNDSHWADRTCSARTAHYYYWILLMYNIKQMMYSVLTPTRRAGPHRGLSEVGLFFFRKTSITKMCRFISNDPLNTFPETMKKHTWMKKKKLPSTTAQYIYFRVRSSTLISNNMPVFIHTRKGSTQTNILICIIHWWSYIRRYSI